MQIDKTTLHDLSVFNTEEEYSLFNRVDYCRTNEGKAILKKIFSTPLSNINEIKDVQQILNFYQSRIDKWPIGITNGTLLVIEKFLDDDPDSIPESPNFINVIAYKFLHQADYSMIVFSMKQVVEFIRGFREIIHFFSGSTHPHQLSELLQECNDILSNKNFQSQFTEKDFKSINTAELLEYARMVHVECIAETRKLIKLYGIFDAWYAMAKTNQILKLHFPEFVEQQDPMIDATGLRHVLLSHPIGYDLTMDRDSNFIFLTGANMAGKSTLIKALGLSVYLAHLGMGVPADTMKLTLFEGILSNINVADNITKGESYFYNEVKRIKETIHRINDEKKWLILIDELFKGTNIQDAMKCSLAVIEGLSKMKNGLFILSSHLYEIGEDLKKIPSISFKYFETELRENQLLFSYKLRDGISKDRMGYLILQQEGVTALLEQIGKKP
ncbi:MAG: MutS-related protein [bacterium]